MTSTMKAIATDARGSIADLKVVELPVPEPGHGEIRVKMVAAAVNPADLKVATGSSGAGFIHAKVFPQIAGYDLAGKVDALGAGVGDVGIGDPVFGHLPYASSTRGGTFAEYATIDAAAVARKPEAVSFETAAALATTGLTALQALRDAAAIGEGSHVLVIGASGGLGALAVPVALRLGAEVTGVCGADAMAFVRELGATHVIDRAAGDPFAGEPRFDAVLDTPSAYSFFVARAVLRPGGTYIPTLPGPKQMLGKLFSLVTPQRMRFVMVKSVRADLEQLGRWAAEGMPVPIERRYPVREAAAAIDAIARGGRRGRIAIDVADGW